MLTDSSLTDRLTGTTAVVLPYRTITHSGQLELARDLLIGIVLPDTPTLRAQLTETGGKDHPCLWFPARALDDPLAFAAALARIPVRFRQAPTPERRIEHSRLLEAHRIDCCFHPAGS